MKKIKLVIILVVIELTLGISGCQPDIESIDYHILTPTTLKDKIKGAWAAQTIGVTYGGPSEFRYLKQMIPDSIQLAWSDTTLLYTMKNIPGLYDDVYMDLTFVEVMEKEGIDAPSASFGKAYANAKYWLWHANQQGRYNILHGINPPESGDWRNNPHADDIDFEIESDFAGIMNPGMPNAALEVCNRVGHVMNSGDGYYGGLFVATMYTYAFIEDSIPAIINHALQVIPAKSMYYQCISDVIKWHAQFPGDWKKTWQLLEDTWGNDIGCPDGANNDFNIDAKMNSAYVVLGLLYGEGDIGKTMEIAIRCGQDADCNPGTAGAIIGTIIGYDKIPKYWSEGLAAIEDMDFSNTHTSLNDVYKISYNNALHQIKEYGGTITDKEVKIKKQIPDIAPLEQNFEGYKLSDNIQINKKITSSDSQELEVTFEGIGAVLRGRARSIGFDDKYALLSQEETLNNYSIMVDFYIDGELSKTMELPLSFIRRAHELFFQYEIPEGEHTLKLIVTNPNEKAYLDVQDLVVYKKHQK